MPGDEDGHATIQLHQVADCPALVPDAPTVISCARGRVSVQRESGGYVMPAECEVLVGGKECGVLAIGRCAIDGRAFCATHNAGAYGHSKTPNRCQPCHERELLEAHEAHLRSPEFYLQGGNAQRDLEAAGVPTVEILAIEYRRHRKTWGSGFQTISTVLPWASGWVIGEFQWHHSPEGSYNVEFIDGPRLTALVSSASNWEKRSCARFVDSNYHLAIITKDPVRDTYLLAQLVGHPLEPLTSIAAAIRQMAGK
jgi:hypothetical protein